MRSWTKTRNAAAFSIFPAHLAGEIDLIAQKVTAIAKAPNLELEGAVLQPQPEIHQGVKDARVRYPEQPSSS